MSRSVVHGRVETVKMKIYCDVKGYHECLSDVEVGEHFELPKKIGSREQALKVCNSRGQLGHDSRRACSISMAHSLLVLCCCFTHIAEIHLVDKRKKQIIAIYTSGDENQ